MHGIRSVDWGGIARHGVAVLVFFDLCLLLDCLLFLAYKLVFVAIFAQAQVTGEDCLRLIQRSLRLDFHSVAQFFLPAMILSLLIVPAWLKRAGRALPVAMAAFLFTFSLFSCLANIYFYKTFNSVINTFFFNFLDEDLVALLRTVWSDYPVVPSLLALAVCAWLSARALRLLQSRIRAFADGMGLWGWCATLVLGTLFYVFAYNGAISFEQSRESRPRAVLFAAISGNRVVNDALSNPMTLMAWMLREYRSTNKISPAKVDYGELSGILDQLGVRHDPQDPLPALYATTRQNHYLERQRPNVVIVYEESFSAHLAQLSDPGSNFDILGSLRQSLDEDFHFAHLISEENSTHASVLRFAFRIPFEKVTNTKYARLAYDTFFLRPFQASGYDTVFISASDSRWGGLDTIFSANGMGEMLCSEQIMKRYPEATMYTWGQEDAYLFKVAYDRLEEARHKHMPVAIYILTSLNHPPYDLPLRAQSDDYKNLDFGSKYSKESFSNYSPELFKRQIKTFKYAAETLGDFITKIRQDPHHSDSTLIAYTGDHNTRISYHDPSSQLLARGVLSGLYVPRAILDHLPGISYEPGRIASHKDLMPTLYEAALSGARYVRLGCNLLSSEKCPYDFAFNAGVTVSKDFRNSVTFTDDDGRHSTIDPRALHDAYTRLLNWVFNYQISTEK